MANVEKITCDWEGCDKPFAYRIRGFNLCSEHCAEIVPQKRFFLRPAPLPEQEGDGK